MLHVQWQFIPYTIIWECNLVLYVFEPELRISELFEIYKPKAQAINAL